MNVYDKIFAESVSNYIRKIDRKMPVYKFRSWILTPEKNYNKRFNISGYARTYVLRESQGHISEKVLKAIANSLIVVFIILGMFFKYQPTTEYWLTIFLLRQN